MILLASEHPVVRPLRPLDLCEASSKRVVVNAEVSPLWISWKQPQSSRGLTAPRKNEDWGSWFPIHAYPTDEDLSVGTPSMGHPGSLPDIFTADTSLCVRTAIVCLNIRSSADRQLPSATAAFFMG